MLYVFLEQNVLNLVSLKIFFYRINNLYIILIIKDIYLIYLIVIYYINKKKSAQTNYGYCLSAIISLLKSLEKCFSTHGAKGLSLSGLDNLFNLIFLRDDATVRTSPCELGNFVF